jgi:hypothetical protein
MDRVYPLLEDIKRQGIARGNFLGLLNFLIGRRIQLVDGTLVSSGLTWRQLAAAFKHVRWDVEAVRELGLDPDRLPPRDREQFWYYAINRARVDSKEAKEAGDRLAEILKAAGYIVGSGQRK